VKDDNGAPGYNALNQLALPGKNMKLHRGSALIIVCLVSLIGSTAFGQSDPAKLAPETAVVYFELSNPGPLLDIALAPKTRKLLENAEGYQKYVQSDKYQQLQTVGGVLEGRLGKGWEAALRELVGGGISVCVDPATGSGFAAVRSRDRELLTKLVSTLQELIETDAKTNSRPSPVKSQEYRGFTGWTFGGDEAHVLVDDLLLISNKADTLKAAIDRFLDPAMKNLAASADFAAARAKRPAGAIGWSWLNLAAVRQGADFQKALNKRSDNPVIELLLAGVIDSVKQSPNVTSSIIYENNSLRLRAELTRQASATSTARAWFFAPHAAELAVTPPSTIGTFTVFRDLAGLWLARDELFDEAVVAKFAQADTQFGLFFSGRDFGPEVLAELDAPLQVIVVRQDYPADKPVPAVKLPAFCLLLKLKHPDDFAPELLLTYQKIIGFANVVGGMQGNPQLLQSVEDYQGTAISKATFLHDSKAPSDKAPLHLNFSPACARIGDHFVFGSTIGIVRQVVDALKHGQSAALLKDNTALTLQASPLAAILSDNKEFLITQNMLGQGHSRSEAETAVQTVLDVLGQLDRFVFKLVDEPNSLALETVLQLKAP
jgi:hypothetical protein